MTQTLKALLGFVIAVILCTPAAFAEQTAANAQDSAQMAQAANPFPDVPTNQWAYDAVRQLAADGYIQGYPDGQYKGQRPMTRYEMAVLTDRAVRSIEAKMTQLQQVEQRDIAAVRALLNGFRPEVDLIKSQIAALNRKTDDQQNQITNLKNEADATQLRVQQGKVGMTFDYRPGTANNNVQVFAPAANGGAGAFLAPGGSTAFVNGPITAPGGIGAGGGANFAPGAAAPVNTIAWAPGGTNATPIGITAHGTNYMVARPIFFGQLSPRFGYGFRLSAKLFNETAMGNSVASPTFCANLTSISCSYSDLNGTQGSIPVNLDYLYVGYTSPGGINARLGRYGVGQSNFMSTPGALLFGGASYSGFAVGYKDTVGRFDSQFYYQIPGQSSYNLAQQQTGGTATAVTGTTPAGGIASTPGCTAGVIGYNLGFVQPIYSGVNPNCNSNGQEIGGYASYFFPTYNTAVGIAMDSLLGRSYTYWDPAAVNCAGTLATSGPVCVANGKAVTATGGFSGAFLNGWGTNAYADAFVSQFFGPHNRPIWKFSAEWGRHLGADPFTGAAWAGANAYIAQVDFASKGNLYSNNVAFSGSALGTNNSNVAQIWFRYFGLGAGSLGQGDPNGTYDPLANIYGSAAANFNGQMGMGINVGHWLNSSLRVGAGVYHMQNIPGVTIPAGSVTGGGACPGCFVNQVNLNGAYLDTFFLFI
ncbi:MAG TPA: S-layer homology domain-containing protein [Candidatus Binatia bacterium]|nr:S-layer homology domain-containing protein [Candidatus Binatia bacterium]